MRVLVACEFSGIVRDAFKEKGHDAWSCDLLPTERNGQHIQGDILEVLNQGWDMMIAHPPCTHLCVRGAWHSKKRGKPEQIDQALDFFMNLYYAPIARVCIENPVGVISSRFRKPDQIVQPCDFGERQLKTTCLWLRGLPPLFYTGMVPRPEPMFRDSTTGKRRYFVDGASNWNIKEAARYRSRTFTGIAEAMAKQWGSELQPA